MFVPQHTRQASAAAFHHVDRYPPHPITHDDDDDGGQEPHSKSHESSSNSCCGCTIM